MVKNKRIFKLIAISLSMLLLVACKVGEKIPSVTTPTEPKLVEQPTEGASTNIVTNEQVQIEEDDSYLDWSLDTSSSITLDKSDVLVKGPGVAINGSKITINRSGTYVISGTLDDGQIIVDTQDKSTVRLVLNGMKINSSNNAPIYVVSAEKTVLSVVEGTLNTITDGKTYILEDASSDEPNSAIFSKDDLVINGKGSLVVNANYNNGITSKDDLKIMEGNITVNSIDDAIMGRDMVYIKSGNFTINADGMGIKTTNDTDTTKGNIFIDGGIFDIDSTDDSLHSVNSIYINSGDFTIITEDDGIHADSTINIAGGNIDILGSYEGIEGSLIKIDSGDINIVSSDDGINIAGGNDESSSLGMFGKDKFRSSSGESLYINGGNISIVTNGDGLDANGSIYMTGGYVIVNGPTSNGNGSLDYDGEFLISGGTLITAGSSGMNQSISESSTQNAVTIYFTETQKSNSKVQLKDSNGNSIITFEPKTNYQAILISTSDIKIDEEYTLTLDDVSVAKFTQSKENLSINDTGQEVSGGGMNRGGKGGFAPGGNPGERPNKGAGKP